MVDIILSYCEIVFSFLCFFYQPNTDKQMKKITSWFTKPTISEPPEKNLPLADSQSNSPNAEFYADYFSLIAKGAKLKLIQAMFGLNLFVLFEDDSSVPEREIIEKLGLMPIRAKKWLHLLSSEGYLVKTTINNQPAYRLPPGFIKLIHSHRWWGMQFFFNSWIETEEENLADVLRFGKIKRTAPWPPKTDSHANWLENWMKNTSTATIECILEHINFQKVTTLLDVGGGDGTMSCAFATAHPHLKAAVYNLPLSAQMARENIAAKQLSDRVQVIEGNFLEDNAFPTGFDLILFARVLFDWNEQVNRKLLTMAYQALPKNGLVAICEFFKNYNHDVCFTCEYRYLFNDDFAAHVMKTKEEYFSMLDDIGFTVIPLKADAEEKHPLDYSLILAKK